MAPFLFDTDITEGGQIVYEVHTVTTSQSILSEVDSLINEHAQTQFNGEWLLVATWDSVPPSSVDGNQDVYIMYILCEI